jgi:cold-inducible RNA-binding protein
VNIYVGNLSFEVTDGDLQEAFSAFGQVTTASVIKDKFTGQSRGFGFVEMPNGAEATAAIAGLNGKDLKGRALNINEARPRTEGGGGGGGGGPRRGGGGGRRREREGGGGYSGPRF